MLRCTHRVFDDRRTLLVSVAPSLTVNVPVTVCVQEIVRESVFDGVPGTLDRFVNVLFPVIACAPFPVKFTA